MSRQFITTGHSGRRQTSELRTTKTHLCRDVFTGIAEELIPLFLAQTGRLPIVLPDVIVNLLQPISVHKFSSSSTAVAGTQCLGSSTLDQRMELAGFSSRGRCVGGSSARSIVRSLVFSGMDLQEIAFAHSDGSLGGQTRALAHLHIFLHLT